MGFNEVQRNAITSDPKWRGGDYAPSEAPNAGVSLARQIAMLTYRSHLSFEARFGQNAADWKEATPMHPRQRVSEYLKAQGERIIARNFDAGSYVCLMDMLDSHDVGRGRGSASDALKRVTQPALIVSVKSDVLYPPSEQRELADCIPNATLFVLDNDEGHDGFFLAQVELGGRISQFLHQLPIRQEESKSIVIEASHNIVIEASHFKEYPVSIAFPVKCERVAISVA
jgi:homoserine O-acetyltransferase